MTQKFHHPSQAKSSGLDEVFQIEFSKTCGPGQGPTCFQENNIKTPGGFRYIDVLRCCNCFWIGEMMPLDCIYIYIQYVWYHYLYGYVCMCVCVILLQVLPGNDSVLFPTSSRNIYRYMIQCCWTAQTIVSPGPQ